MDLAFLERVIKVIREHIGDSGFGSPAYFTSCFHAQYGYPPGEIRKGLHPYEPSEKVEPVGKRITMKGKWWMVGVVSTVILIGMHILINVLPGAGLVKSLAVLPFQSIDPTETDGLLTDEITEQLISILKKSTGLNVLPAIKTKEFRVVSKSAQEIGEELKVEFIVKGNLGIYGSRIKIWVYLYSSEKTDCLWKNEYTRDVRYLTDVQDEIASDIGKQISEVIQNN